MKWFLRFEFELKETYTKKKLSQVGWIIGKVGLNT
jgi:hypothetical protein